MTDAVWLAARAAGFVLTLQAAGVALFVAAFGGRLGASRALLRRGGVRLALAALTVLGLQYLLEPMHLAGDWSGLADPALQRLLLHSTTGAAFAVRAAGLACVLGGCAHAAPGRAGASVAGALTSAASFLLVGHTAVAAPRIPLALLLLCHLLIVAFWLGSLWALRRLGRIEPRERVLEVLAAFSAVALWLVPLIGVAGAGIAVLLLPDAAALVQPYGLLLICKVALFAALLGLAAVNKLRLVPALARAAPRALTALERSILAEYALICVVLAITAAMTGFFSPGGASGA